MIMIKTLLIKIIYVKDPNEEKYQYLTKNIKKWS